MTTTATRPEATEDRHAHLPLCVGCGARIYTVEGRRVTVDAHDPECPASEDGHAAPGDELDVRAHVERITAKAGLGVMCHVLDVLIDREEVPDAAFLALTPEAVTDMYEQAIGPAIDTLGDWLPVAAETGTAQPCIVTGAPGEDPDDCTTHDHEAPPALGTGPAPDPEDCDGICARHAHDCDGYCDHLPGHRNACLTLTTD